MLLLPQLQRAKVQILVPTQIMVLRFHRSILDDDN
jgi:hypothetical protein